MPEREWRWFVYFINGRTSKMAHALSVVWTCKDDGEGVSACGVNPYDYAPKVAGGALTVGFMPAGDTPHCTGCVAVVEASNDERAVA